MSDTVTIESRDAYTYYLQWITDGEEGACIGDELYDAADLAKADKDMRWFVAATIAVAGMKPKPERRKGGYGFEFDSKTRAKEALRLAKAAKNHPYPMPEWATQAIAAGWKAPKGWKP